MSPLNLPSSLKSMCETSASHAGVGLGETLGVDLVGEAQPFTQGTGQVERRGETSCLPADYSRQRGKLENSGWRCIRRQSCSSSMLFD